MIVVSWNVGGLNHISKQKELVDLDLSQDPHILILTEHKIKEVDVDFVISSRFRG